MMVSATHFIEFISVENSSATTKYCRCGSQDDLWPMESSSSDSSSSSSSLVIPESSSSSSSATSGECVDTTVGSVGGSYLITALVKPAYVQTFFNGNTHLFSPGEYELKYLGGTHETVAKCQEFGNWAYVNTLTESISSVYNPDLTKFQSFDYERGTTAHWWVVNGLSVSQAHNGVQTFLVSPDDFIDDTFTARIVVSGSKKDVTGDYVGIVFGFSTWLVQGYPTPNSYYVLMWKRAQQVCPADKTTVGKIGVRLLKVENSRAVDEATLWCALWAGANWSSGAARITKIAEDLSIGWEYNAAYDFTVTHRSDGNMVLNIKTAGSYTSLWSRSYHDPAPLTGKVGLFNLSQANVTYTPYRLIKSQYINEYPGTVCMFQKESITFNGGLGGIGVLIGPDDQITQSDWTVPGDPVTFTLPAKHIILADNSGYCIGSSGLWNSPLTSYKEFSDGTHWAYFDTGSPSNIGTGHATDLAAAGFTVRALNYPIPIADLQTNGWIARDGTFRFKFVHIPCGMSSGNMFISTRSLTVPTVDNYDWKTVVAAWPIGPAPTVVGGTTRITLDRPARIGVQLDVTPTSISSPQFLLTQLSIPRAGCNLPTPVVRSRTVDTTQYMPLIQSEIRMPKQIVWTQENATSKIKAYRYKVQIGQLVYDTDYADDLKYFRFNGAAWTPGDKIIEPHSSAEIKFNIPFDTTETGATIATIIKGDVVEQNTYDIELRTFTEWSLKLHRDLVPPDISPAIARTVAYRCGIRSLAGFTPYLYQNSDLIKITWDAAVRNGDTVVCIADDVVLPQVASYLKNSKGILPRRYVAIRETS